MLKSGVPLVTALQIISGGVKNPRMRTMVDKIRAEVESGSALNEALFVTNFLDYRFLQVTVNQHSARYEDDGSARIVVAPEDPGVGNWMDTAGHRHGTMGVRWVRADAHAPVETSPTSNASFSAE